jgi:predicted PurR-regulated permease PerM
VNYSEIKHGAGDSGNAGGVSNFTHKALVAAVTITLLLLWKAREVFLLVFAGILLAVLIDGLAGMVSGKTRLPRGWALVVVMLALVGAIVAGGWLLTPRVVAQVEELSQSLSNSIERVRAMLTQYALGQWLLDSLPRSLTSGGMIEQALGGISTAMGAVVNTVVVIFIGVYLAVDPRLYAGGLTRLLSQEWRGKADEVFTALGLVLQRWLAGRFLLMGVNGLLTALGLLLLGVPLPWTLGVLTGLLNFIPNLGPIMAAVPALLISFAQSPRQALYTPALYVFLQNLDGYVFTPFVQRRTVALPPALTITAQVLLGVSLGSLGLLLATPLAAAALVIVKMLYLRDTLDQQIMLPIGNGAQERRQGGPA